MDFNYLIRWVIVTYIILLDINVINSHGTSAYKFANCSPLRGTIYRAYDLTMRISDSAVKKAPIRCLRGSACKHSSCAFVTRSKLIAA